MAPSSVTHSFRKPYTSPAFLPASLAGSSSFQNSKCPWTSSPIDIFSLGELVSVSVFRISP